MHKFAVLISETSASKLEKRQICSDKKIKSCFNFVKEKHLMAICNVLHFQFKIYTKKILP